MIDILWSSARLYADVTTGLSLTLKILAPIPVPGSRSPPAAWLAVTAGNHPRMRPIQWRATRREPMILEPMILR
jgi:hypothetical protein